MYSSATLTSLQLKINHSSKFFHASFASVTHAAVNLVIVFKWPLEIFMEELNFR